MGALSIMIGSSPRTLMWWIRARGVRPWVATAASLAMSSEAEASLIWLAMAAVIRPPSTRVGRLRIFSQFGSRGPSSRARSPTGAISASKRPSAAALRARVWDSTANSSMSSRLMSQRSAIISAPRNWLTSPSP